VLPGRSSPSETALACLFRLGAQNGVYAEIGAVRRRNLIEGDSLPVARLVELAGEFGLRAERVRLDWEGLRNTPFSHPILLLLDNNNAVVLVGVRRNGPEEVAVSDPVFRDGEPFFLAREDLERAWCGSALVVTPLPPTKADTAFGFSWFTTKLFAERRLMRDIVAALVMHLIGLSVPIFFQLLVDKVVPNQAFSTLYALSAGVGVLILFDAGFNYLRNYLLAFITRRLDHQVANSMIEHLLRLPIDYFHANPSGVTAYKLQEANNVRDFLASRLFNTFLDFLAVIIYLPVLLLYSWQLTLIVLGVSATAFVVLAAMSRTFRKRLTEVNEIEGRRKAFLFEILNGMATIKTLALDAALAPPYRRGGEQEPVARPHRSRGPQRRHQPRARHERRDRGIGCIVRAERPDDRRRARRLQHAGTAAGPAADPRLLADAGLSALGAVLKAPRPADADRARTV
jgi:subfamily B ATP-binding cassette protein HlyB/CyaB